MSCRPREIVGQRVYQRADNSTLANSLSKAYIIGSRGRVHSQSLCLLSEMGVYLSRVADSCKCRKGVLLKSSPLCLISIDNLYPDRSVLTLT
jgi:hypothetical protein